MVHVPDVPFGICEANDKGTVHALDVVTSLAIVPVATEYYVVKKVNPGKKNESFVSVEGKELEKIEGIFQSRLGAIDYDNE